MADTRALRQQVQEAAAKIVAAIEDIPEAIPARQQFVTTLVEKLQGQVPGATDRQASRAINTAIRERLGESATRAGRAPNAHLVLNDDELAFIEAHYDGSKSAAIHAGLALLVKQRRKAKA